MKTAMLALLLVLMPVAAAADYVAVAGYFDGDRRLDFGIYWDGWWYIERTASPGGTPDDPRSFIGVWFGSAEDVPMPGDYDGDGITDLAVYRPRTGELFVWESHEQRLRHCWSPALCIHE